MFAGSGRIHRPTAVRKNRLLTSNAVSCVLHGAGGWQIVKIVIKIFACFRSNRIPETPATPTADSLVALRSTSSLSIDDVYDGRSGERSQIDVTESNSTQNSSQDSSNRETLNSSEESTFEASSSQPSHVKYAVEPTIVINYDQCKDLRHKQSREGHVERNRRFADDTRQNSSTQHDSLAILDYARKNFQETDEEFESARKMAREAKLAFKRVKKRRFNKFTHWFDFRARKSTRRTRRSLSTASPPNFVELVCHHDGRNQSRVSFLLAVLNKSGVPYFVSIYFSNADRESMSEDPLTGKKALNKLRDEIARVACKTEVESRLNSEGWSVFSPSNYLR